MFQLIKFFFVKIKKKNNFIILKNNVNFKFVKFHINQEFYILTNLIYN